MIEKTDDTIIPKKLHAIWLGGILKEAGKKNIVEWKTKNPDYEANVWIDSSTYLVGDSPEAMKQKEEYEQFKEWANANQINIIDINPNATDADPAVIKRPELFTGMNSAKYYLDELKDPGSNYAAASDILRTEILYHEGGVYFDAEDVFPRKPLGQLNAQQGMLCRIWGGNYTVNNDAMASIPQGKLINQLRDVIQKNYDELYSKDKRYLTAHRFANLFSFRTNNGDRKNSTIMTSGPGALRQVIGYEPTSQLKLHFSLIDADEQALSWLDNNFNTIEKLTPYFRLNLIEYFNLLTEHYANNSNLAVETKQLLTQFKNAINSQSPPPNMIELLHHVKSLFNEDQIAQINSSTDNLFSEFENHANQAEEFLLYCKHGNVDPKDLYRFIKGRSSYYTPLETLQEAFAHPYNILHFFHEEFSKGFFEIIKLPPVGKIEYRRPWSCSFSAEQQKQLTELVETEMKQLRGDTPTVSTLSEPHSIKKTDNAAVSTVQSATLEQENPLKKQQKAPPHEPHGQHSLTASPKPISMEKENQSNNQQKKTTSESSIKDSESKIRITNTYPYGKNGTGRSHLVPAKYKGKFSNYTGDALKRIILDDFKKKIEHCSTIKELNVFIKSILATEELEVLKTPQRMASAILGLKTSAIESLEDMLSDAATQIKEKNNTQKLQDEDLISLESDRGENDKENSDTNTLSL
ncbi:putative teichoic acid biosynthesis protein [Legionella moravica]|uniref:Teichoic acid biosynthesis protein n=1 Tax=Legionella moravica TaxID=39962 RepID=A0A378JTY9_9GAMM|nr:TcdA/TcdB catalytic glycosyltransferase domain-containing protein [Legionella moravica]KTD32643.1 putative teichoic acid biosynthesis protein [Legionella moravica]STX61467.1 putative teichoic acid biosynthesis protein [Legionella moravica]